MPQTTRIVPLTTALLLSLLPVLASADDAVSPEEWRYMQGVGIISGVNESLWRLFEESGGLSPELARYARDATRLNVRTLRSWGAPAQPLRAFHSSLVDLLVQVERFYGAVSEGDLRTAQDIGGSVEREMLAFEKSWERLGDRYAMPASR